MLNEQGAIKIAEPIVESIVNLISKNDYESMLEVVTNSAEDLRSIQDWVNSFLEMNGMDGIDSYDVECRFSPNYEYHQLSCYLFDDGSGFAVDYDLTSDGELSDLTLQIDFKKQQDDLYEAHITGIDVL